MDEQQLFGNIRDMFYDEEDFDDDWFQRVISQKFRDHQLGSLNWKHPTDFEKFVKAFDELIGEEKIVPLNNAGYTKSDDEGVCLQTIEPLGELGIVDSG